MVWVSIIVVRTSLWLRLCCIWRMSSCACNRDVAHVCRRVCGDTRLGMPALRAAALIACWIAVSCTWERRTSRVAATHVRLWAGKHHCQTSSYAADVAVLCERRRQKHAVIALRPVLLRELPDLFERPHDVTMDRVRPRHGPRCAVLAERDCKPPRVHIDLLVPQMGCLGMLRATPVQEHRQACSGLVQLRHQPFHRLPPQHGGDRPAALGPWRLRTITEFRCAYMSEQP